MSFEDQSAALQTRIADIKKKYDPQLQSLSEKGKKLGDDYERPSDVVAVVGVDFRVDWKNVELTFDIPSITVEDRNQALGTISTAIDDLQRQGCDPIKVPTPNGDVNLRKIYEDVIAGKARAVSEFDQVAGVVG